MRRNGLLAAYVALITFTGCQCGAPRTEIPRLEVARAQARPLLDGVLDDPIWDHATRTEAFVDTLDGHASSPSAHATLASDDDALYIAFEVDDPFLRCTFEGHDAHLWEQDAVELMIDPDGDAQNYVELQVSPSNLVFDTFFDTPRAPPPFGHASWSSHLQSAVHLEGTLNDDEADNGYTVEIAIPWSAFSAIGAARPAHGDTWRIALYVLDARQEGQAGVGWSAPLVGDFHVPARFGYVTF